MQRFRDSLNRFMVGRYGIDELYRFIMYTLFVLLVVQLFTRITWLTVVIWVLLIIGICRICSRNIMARRAENQKFLQLRNGFTSEIRLCRDKFRDRKTKVYRKCPYCKAVIRLPREKGRHSVTCPRCQKQFSVKV